MGRKVIISCDGEGCTETHCSTRPPIVSWLCRTISDDTLDLVSRVHAARYYCPRCALGLTPPVLEPLRRMYEQVVSDDDARLARSKGPT